MSVGCEMRYADERAALARLDRTPHVCEQPEPCEVCGFVACAWCRECNGCPTRCRR